MKKMSEEYVKVAESKDIGTSSMKAVEVDGETVCVINAGGNYYAIGNVCTHVGGPLNEEDLRVLKLNVRGMDQSLILGLVSQRSLLQQVLFQNMRLKQKVITY